MFRNFNSLKISIIVATFNRANLLAGFFDSATRQNLSRKEVEIIVIDDGSSDNTKQIVENFKKILPIKYFFQRNSGIASARNHGIFAASGRILLFFDDDDQMMPDLLSKHLEAHKKYPEEYFAVLNYTDWNPNLDVSPLMHFIVEEGRFLFSFNDLQNGDILNYTYFWGGRISCKRDFLLKHGVFNQKFRFGCEDIELGYRLANFGLKIVYNEKAKSMMSRPISFDDFVNRLYKQGRSQFLFNKIYNNSEIEKWAEVEHSKEIWGKISPFYENKLKSAKHLDDLAKKRLEMGMKLDEQFIRVLYDSYFWIFRATKIKGIIDKKNEEKQ